MAPTNPGEAELIQLALDHGADYAAMVTTTEIEFVPGLRSSCDMNHCGRFNTCWVGPPAIGSVEELMAKAMVFPRGLVVQTVGQLEDSFDYEGMMAAKEKHVEVFRSLFPAVRSRYAEQQILALSCGCCDLCPVCTYPDEPCRYPEEAVSAVEAYGIAVTPMLTACGLKYNNGPNTVSYVSLFLVPPSS